MQVCNKVLFTYLFLSLRRAQMRNVFLMSIKLLNSLERVGFIISINLEVQYWNTAALYNQSAYLSP